METETAAEYLSRCPHREDCGKVICSPWGIVSSEESNVRGKKLLVVGLNANDSKDGESLREMDRDNYSNGLKEMMQKDIMSGKLKCLSNLMEPIARFLLDDGSPESQNQALNLIEWCNMVSCCPAPDPDGKVAPASKPSNAMRNNCVKRLVEGKEGERHELLHRLSLFQPTHILVVRGDAKVLWERAARPGTVLSTILNQNPRPTVAFSWHPSQRRYPRRLYWDRVYEQLSKEA